MNRNTQSALMALLGGVLISITVSGRFTSYVKPGFGPLLVIAGLVLIAVGVASLLLELRVRWRGRGGSGIRQRSDPVSVNELSLHAAAGRGEALHPQGLAEDGHLHDRSAAPWLILAPVLVLLLLAPPALGADAVSRNAGSQALAGVAGVAAPAAAGADVAAGGEVGGYAPNDGSGTAIGTKAFAKQRPTMAFPPLPGGTDPVLTLKDFVLRALYDGGNSVSDNDITVVGFIAPPGDGYDDGYSLARMTISCCAADASPMRIHLPGAAKYPVNTWVQAVVSARPGTATETNDYVPAADLTSMIPIRQPADPYEH